MLSQSRKCLGVMTLDGSMDSAAFKVYISKCLVPQLWQGAVVVMDNLPAHKVKAISPLMPGGIPESKILESTKLIEAAGARILYLSPYSPEFNPIEHWWCSAKRCTQGFLKAVLAENLQNG